MKPQTPALATAPVRLFVALAALLLSSWPILSIPGSRGLFAMFDYVFALWAALLVLLVFVGRACASEREPPAE